MWVDGNTFSELVLLKNSEPIVKKFVTELRISNADITEEEELPVLQVALKQHPLHDGVLAGINIIDFPDLKDPDPIIIKG